MPEYRIYQLSAPRAISARHEIVCETAVEAEAEATRLALTCYGVEIWMGTSLVLALSGQGGQSGRSFGV